MKDFIIYQKGTTRVYIHKGTRKTWRKGKWIKNKLCWYGIRRDDDTGLADLQGIISFNPRWRQYTSKFESDTEWSSGCKQMICIFENKINREWRLSVRGCKK